MKKYVLILLTSIVLSIFVFSNILINAWCLLTYNEFFIPKESNIFTFEVTKMSEGNGEWWLYSEDRNFYYALNLEEDYAPRYFKLPRGSEISNFDKLDYKTWNIQ